MVNDFKSILRYSWFGLVFVAAGIGLMVMSFYTTKTNWPKTDALVTKMEKEPSSTSKTSYDYIPYVSYYIEPDEYYVNIRLDTYITGTTEVGKTVSIRYNPSNHKEITYYYSSALASLPFIAGLIFSAAGTITLIYEAKSHARLTPIK